MEAGVSEGGIVMPTLSVREASTRQWGAIVVGAGPAGSAAARRLAMMGESVLLIDKASFPRWKVCGCCLSAAGVRALGELGLGELPARSGALSLRQLDLGAGNARAQVGLGGGVALSRETLDAALVRGAISEGADFLDRTCVIGSEVIERERTIRVRAPDATEVRVRGRVILAADGLAAGFSSTEPRCETRASRRGLIGLGATLEILPPPVPPGIVSMSVGRGGYVGAVVLEDGRLNVAAAIDPRRVRRLGSAGAAIAEVLSGAGRDWGDVLAGVHWRGTLTLTRGRRVEAERLMVLGDAAAYVEPFTGEGMTWALAGGIAAAESAGALLRGRITHLDWSRCWGGQIGTAQRRCTLVALALRQPRLARGAVRLMGAAPRIARPLVGLFGADRRAVGA
jgi:menaquinone-9 beta-reductase